MRVGWLVLATAAADCAQNDFLISSKVRTGTQSWPLLGGRTQVIDAQGTWRQFPT